MTLYLVELSSYLNNVIHNDHREMSVLYLYFPHKQQSRLMNFVFMSMQKISKSLL